MNKPLWSLNILNEIVLKNQLNQHEENKKTNERLTKLETQIELLIKLLKESKP